METKKATGGTEKGGVQFSIRYDKNNNPFVVVENDILLGKSKNQWAAIVKKNLAEKFPNGVMVGNNLIKINKQSREEITFSEYTKQIAKHNKSVYADKFRATDNVDEIILASREYINEGLKHARKDKIKDFARGNILMRIGNTDYTAEVVVGTKKNGQMLLYDIVNLQKTEIKERKSPKPATEKVDSRTEALPNNNSMLHSAQKVNTQFSKRAENLRFDSEGRELSEQQQEFFKDSKVRDEEGRLLTVYHGSDNEFFVFDRTKARANMDIQGSFFSPWEIDAQGYGGKVGEYYLNIVNPASEAMGYKALKKFQGQNGAGIKAREYLQSLGYDGVNNGGEEYIAFESNQIKSVTNQTPTENPDIRYSKRGNFTEDKYYSRQIDNLENLKEGSYITVGEIKKDSPLNLVGIPDKRLYFDVSKIRQEMKDRSDPIPSEKIKDIPKVLDNPIVITEYVDKRETHSVNVYGKLYIGSSPVVIGVMIAKTPKGNLVNKVQTVHPNRNFVNEMAADRILYLTPNKKEARQWFQSLSAQMPLLRGNKSGFIRSIAQEGNEVKSSVSDLGKIKYQLRIEDKNRLDILDKQEERLANDLKTLEKAYGEAIRREYEQNTKPDEGTSERAARINEKAAMFWLALRRIQKGNYILFGLS